MGECEKEIIQKIRTMTGKFSVYQIFDDWVHLLALEMSIAVDTRTKAERLEAWNAIREKYSTEELKTFVEITALLVDAFEEEPTDVLGYVYMHLEQGAKNLGQFFTPFHLCVLMAKLQWEKVKDIPEDEKITINEPSCGAGGNIIAMLLECQKHGVNYQKRCEIVAQDLDYRCVYMCYVQLSLLGANALVVQGDTLMQPYDKYRTKQDHIFITPMRAGALV